MPDYRAMRLKDVLNILLDDLQMSTRLYNCLNKRGWKRIEDIAYRTHAELHNTRNLGGTTMRELEKLLGKMEVGIGLLNKTENRTIWARMRRQPLLSQLDHRALFRAFCDIVQPRSR